jgi:hypothetical protein
MLPIRSSSPTARAFILRAVIGPDLAEGNNPRNRVVNSGKIFKFAPSKRPFGLYQAEPNALRFRFAENTGKMVCQSKV